MPQRPSGLAVVDLEIGDHGVHHRIPIDQPLVAVDQPFSIELDEDAADRGRQARIHREPLASPIWRGAETPELSGEGTAGLLFPFPDARDELLAAEIAFPLAFRSQLVGDDDIGCDARIVW